MRHPLERGNHTGSRRTPLSLLMSGWAGTLIVLESCSFCVSGLPLTLHDTAGKPLVSWQLCFPPAGKRVVDQLCLNAGIGHVREVRYVIGRTPRLHHS